MTGKEFKEKILQTNVSPSTLAERLGITAQALNSTFKGKAVRSDTIERAAQALGVDMSFFYPMAGTNNSVASGDGSISVASNGNVHIEETSILQERIKALEQQVKDKESLLAEKERLIKILMEK